MRFGDNVHTTIEALETRRLLATINVTTTADDLTPTDGTVSLREAITAINAGNDLGDPDITAQNPGTFGTNDAIDFNIPVSGVQTITLSSNLPTVTKTVVIDGYTQPGASANTLAVSDNAVLLIDITDGGTGNSLVPLDIKSNFSTVRGLAINNFGPSGPQFPTAITLDGNHDQVQGNFIGTDASGATASLLTSGTGVAISGNFNLIGGTDPADRNIIAACGEFGINIPGNQNQVEGNYIGTNAAGDAAIPNGKIHTGFSAVLLGGSGNQLGGALAGAGNVISGNFGAGVLIGRSFSNTLTNASVQGNLIGTDATGTHALGNAGNGITIGGSAFQETESGSLIGGIVPAAGNVIAYNGGAGVEVSATTDPGFQVSVTLSAIRFNSIYSNTGLGIDLTDDSAPASIEDDGITANDPLDADGGPNDLQNFPMLTSAANDNSGTTIQGSFNSTANSTFILDFYSNDALDNFGTAQGKTYLGSVNVQTDALGNANFSTTVPTVAAGQYIDATATTFANFPAGDTSEFSPPMVVTAPPPPPALPTLSIDSVSNTEGNSGTKDFTFTITRSGDLSGASSVAIATADGTAKTSDNDYIANATVVDFAAGDSSKSFTVQVKGDTKVEADETFFVNLTGATGATIASGQGTGTIQNDDVSPPPPPPSGTVSIITDPCDSSKKALKIVGTNNSDGIAVNYAGAQGKAQVTINGVNKGTFNFSGTIQAYGEGGNDKITVSSSITRSAWIWGGDGKDTASGGGGNDFLFGNDGDDSLSGNNGRDILIGGDGTDKLFGGSGDDLLVAGEFKATPTTSQLCSIQKEWIRTDKSYSLRTSHLQNGGGYNTVKLNASTLYSSASLKDSLTGNADNDLFFAAVPGDVVLDKGSGETVVDIG